MRILFRVLFAVAVAAVLTSPLAAQDGELPAALDAANPFYVDPSAPDENGEAPEATIFSYYHVLGTSMRPRESATTTYDGAGCAHMTGGDGYATFPVTIPDGSLIQYVRLYYCDTDAASDVQAYLYEFNPPGVAYTELFNLPSGSSAGCGSVLSPALNYTVANQAALALLVGGSDANEQYCGLRVAYYEP